MENAELNSLNNFFYQNSSVTLNNCEQEPIHLIGEVTEEGFLLVVCKSSASLVGWSSNAQDSLSKELYFGESLKDISTDLFDKVESILGQCHGHHVVLSDVKDLDFTPVYHENDHYGLLEFLPNNELTAANFLDKLRDSRQDIFDIIAAQSFDRSLQLTAEAVKRISGFGRVKIYEFQSDWSGKVVAESKDKDMTSYLGLVFPEGDIPKQARYLMQHMHARGIWNAKDKISSLTFPKGLPEETQLDMTWSLLRYPSKIHTQYLRNMGIDSSFTVSLMRNGKLWGLIACHDPKPKSLPYDLWGLCIDIGASLMTKLDQLKAKEEARMLTRLREVEDKIALQLKEKKEINSAIDELAPELQELLHADGFVFRYGALLYSHGTTLPDELTAELVHWASTHAEDDTFMCSNLSDLWPKALEFKESVCGVLIEPVQLHRICHLIWFRKPVVSTIDWAGNPYKKDSNVEQLGQSRPLSPRASFEKWSEQNIDHSEEWRKEDSLYAKEIFKSMVDIVAAHLISLRSKDNLRTFSYAAAHDLRAPIRHIKYAIQEVCDNDLSSEDSRELLGKALSASNRLEKLIESMNEVLLIEREPDKTKRFSLGDVVETAKENNESQIKSSNADIRVQSSEVLSGDYHLIANLFGNLINNSIKFRQPDVKPLITITAKERIRGRVDIEYTDNGLGIPERYQEEIFKPFKRVHAKQATPGTGLGLAICRRIVELHGGTIHLDPLFKGGAKFVIMLNENMV